MFCVVLLFCASIVQGYGTWVSPLEGEITRFPMTQSVTFIAHNDLIGEYFKYIEVGDTILLLEDDPKVYEVIEVIVGQASDPTSETTNVYIDSQWMTPEQVYHRVGYLDPEKLVLQTCIERDGDPSWGRLFVVARPVELSD